MSRERKAELCEKVERREKQGRDETGSMSAKHASEEKVESSGMLHA